MTFFILSFLLIISSLYILFTKNPFKSVLALLINFLLTGIFYLLLGSPLLFILQILIYAGGIIILILFTISTLRPREIKKIFSFGDFIFCVSLLFAFLLGLGIFFFQLKIPSYYLLSFEMEKVISTLLIDNFIPFEFITLVLLVAIIGAFVLTRKE